MANLPITIELIRDVLKNFEGRPVDDNLIQEVGAEVTRIRTVENPVTAAGEPSATVAGVFGEAENEAAPPPENQAPPLGAVGDDPGPEGALGEPGIAETPRVSKPREKMQKLVVLYDPENRIPREPGFLSYIIEIPADDPPDGRTFNPRLLDAITSHNESKRGRQHPVETFRDAMEKLPYDWLRYYKIRMLTETAVYVLLRNAELPQPPEPPAEPAAQ